MNRRLGVSSLAFLATFAVVAAGCSDGSGTGTDTNAAGASGCKTGANAAWANPAGTAFSLPAGVVVKGAITSEVGSGPCEPLTTLEYGGDLLPACVGLENTTGADVKVTFPAGLVFLAQDPGTQNGIILQDHEVTIPAGVKYFRFDLFCLNEQCTYGEGAKTILTFGNVSQDPLLRELVALARGRRMNRSAAATAYAFGQAIWDITGGRGLTAERKKLIADTPDGS